MHCTNKVSSPHDLLTMYNDFFYYWVFDFLICFLKNTNLNFEISDYFFRQNTLDLFWAKTEVQVLLRALRLAQQSLSGSLTMAVLLWHCPKNILVIGSEIGPLQLRIRVCLLITLTQTSSVNRKKFIIWSLMYDSLMAVSHWLSSYYIDRKVWNSILHIFFAFWPHPMWCLNGKKLKFLCWSEGRSRFGQKSTAWD